jgi:hypothetical protein
MPDGKPYNPFNPDPTYRSQYKPFSTEVSSSCLKCHQKADMLGATGQKLSGDFVFVLGGAQSATTTTAAQPIRR